MVSRHGNHLLVLNAKGNGRIYFAQLDFGHPPILVHTEGIVEVLADAFERLPCSEYVDPMDRGIIDEIEGPHVVQSSDMVFVFVRQQNRVDMPDPGPEHLVTEIGPSVDHQPYVVPLEHGRSPQTVIAGIFRGADGTPAADHRHSLRSSRAKNYKFHTHRKKTSEFLFFPATGTKIQKKTPQKREIAAFSRTLQIRGAARFTVRSNRLERLSVSFEGRRKRSTIPRVTPAVHTRTIRYLSEKF